MPNFMGKCMQVSTIRIKGSCFNSYAVLLIKSKILPRNPIITHNDAVYFLKKAGSD